MVGVAADEFGGVGIGFLPPLQVLRKGQTVTEEKSTQTLFPFLQVGIVWFGVAALLCWILSDSMDVKIRSLRWLLILWGLCLMDLLALAKLMQAMLALMAGGAKNQGELVIRASSWGTAKLACLGLLGFVLYHGRVVPTVALLSGLATMFIVPIAGGAWWYQRMLRHGRTWL